MSYSTTQELIQKITGRRIKSINIDVTIDEPYMLVSRTHEKNISILIEDSELAIAKKDRYKTRITAIPIEKITKITIDTLDDNTLDIWFTVNELLIYNIVVEMSAASLINK